MHDARMRAASARRTSTRVSTEPERSCARLSMFSIVARSERPLSWMSCRLDAAGSLLAASSARERKSSATLRMPTNGVRISWLCYEDGVQRNEVQ